MGQLGWSDFFSGEQNFYTADIESLEGAINKNKTTKIVESLRHDILTRCSKPQMFVLESLGLFCIK